MTPVKEKLENLKIAQWINSEGKKTTPINFSDYEGKFKVIFCFQHWCPGCHSVGLPSLKKIVDAFQENPTISFFAIQTVFEGPHENTFEKIIETQKKYDLKIPFAHDPGDENSYNRSKLMHAFDTGGTPWYLFIDQNNRVLFNDFHIRPVEAIEYLESLLA